MVGTKDHGDVAERRLRPVYDALDNMNNKQAIKLADNILKKQRDFFCAKALKALALIRSGRSGDGVGLLEEIRSSDPKYDDSTLQAMSMCYKETSLPKEIVAIYEVAVQQSPKNEEFLTHFFMSCVRVEDYSKQQKAAMNLYKSYTKNPYYFWAVMTNFMQGLNTKDEKKKNMFLVLAERMVSKFINEDKIEAEEEIRLYMLILENLGKFGDLLELVEGGLGEKLKCMSNEKPEKEIEYLTKLGRWAEVYAKYKTLLEKTPDQWKYYCGYFDSIEKLKTQKTSDVVNNDDSESVDPGALTQEATIPDVSFESVMTTLQKLRDDNPIMRGPFLAMMELYKRTHDEAPLALVDLLHQYYKQFGRKLCCFSDMKPYTNLLQPEQANQFIEHLKTTYKIHEPDDTETPLQDRIDDLMREICVECLSRQLCYYDGLSREDMFSKAKYYMKRYKDALVYTENLNSTEPQYGDTLVLLAAYLLLDINDDKGDNSMLWHVLLILEEAVEISPSTAQFKLLLMFLYSKLGAYGACDELIWQDMEVRYIMYDSLGYLLTYGGYTSGHFQSIIRLHDASIGFFNSSQKDTSEQIIAAYKYGSFRQIPEITRFKKRVKASCQFSYSLLENVYLGIVRQANGVEESKEKLSKAKEILEKERFQNITIEDIFDNRDFGVMDNYDPISKHLTAEQKLASFKQNVCWIRMRYYLLYVIIDCFNGNDGNAESESDGAELDLDQHISLLKEVIAESSELQNVNSSWERIHYPPPSYLVSYSQCEYIKVLTNFAQICSNVMKETEVSEEFANSINLELKEAQDGMKRSLNETIDALTALHVDNLMFNGNSLPKVVFYVETCSLTAILLYSILDIVKKNLATQRKAKKKKPGQAPVMKHDSIVETVKECLTSFHADLTLLQEKLKELKANHIDRTLEMPILEELFEKTNSTTVTKIWQKVQASYQQSINEISQILTLKIHFYRTLMS